MTNSPGIGLAVAPDRVAVVAVGLEDAAPLVHGAAVFSADDLAGAVDFLGREWSRLPRRQRSMTLAVDPTSARHSVLNMSPLEPRALHRWLGERAALQSDQTVAHRVLDQRADRIEVLEVCVPRALVNQGVKLARSVSGSRVQVVDPRMAGAARVPRHTGSGAVLIADLLSERVVALHLWEDGELNLVRDIKISERDQNSDVQVAREILRSTTYYRERSQGQVVRDVTLVQTAGVADLVHRTASSLVELGYGGQVEVLLLPESGVLDDDPLLGLAYNLALDQARHPVRFVDGVVRRRRNLGWFAEALLAAGFLVATPFAAGWLDTRIEVAQDSLAQVRDATRPLVEEWTQLQAHRDLGATLQTALDHEQRNLPVFTVASRIQATVAEAMKLRSFRVHDADGPVAVFEGSAEFTLSVEAPWRPLERRLRELPGVLDVDVEVLHSKLPGLDDDAVLREDVRVSVRLQERLGQP